MTLAAPLDTLPPLTEITTAAAWRGDALSAGDSWIDMLSDAQIAELERLGTQFVEDDPDLRFVQKEEYPLVECRAAVEEWGCSANSQRSPRARSGSRAGSMLCRAISR